MAMEFGSDTSLAFSILKAEFRVTVVPELDAALVDLRLLAKNDLPRQRAGNTSSTRMKVRVPVPDAARICGFSFGGVPAVAVQKKEAARIVYLEAEQGGAVARADNVEAPTQATHTSIRKLYTVFETEVHPFPFGEEREIAVSFYCPGLGRCASDHWTLGLPVQLGGCRPSVEATSVPGGPVEVFLETDGDEISIQGPLPKGPRRLFLADAYNASHFCASIPATVESMACSPSAALVDNSDRTGATISATLLWDSSRSRAEVDHESAFSLLSEMGRVAKRAGRSLEVTVVAFDVQPRVLAEQVSIEDAVHALRGLQRQYDGGTDLSCLKSALCKAHDFCMLFSDGGDNLGAGGALSLLQAAEQMAAPLHVVWEGGGKPPDALAALARSTAGVCASVSSANLPRVLCGLDVPLHVERVELEGLELEDLVEEALDTIPDCRLSRQCWPIQGGGLRVSGTLGSRKPSCVKVTVADGSHRRDVALSLADAFQIEPKSRAASLVALLHCEQQLMFDALIAPGAVKCNKPSVAAACRYNVATPHTSLLMLDRAEQFIQHSVPCPEGHPAFSAWQKLVQQRASTASTAPANKSAHDEPRLVAKEVSARLAAKLASYLKDPKQFAPPDRASAWPTAHPLQFDPPDRAGPRGGRAVGIDLGTTNSCIGMWQSDSVTIVANEEGNRTTPSCVAVVDGVRVVGDQAVERGRSSPESTAFEAKRLIGRNFSDPRVQDDVQRWPFKVSAGDGDKPVIELGVGEQRQRLHPEEVSALVLRKLKDLAQQAAGEEIQDAVITVPAYFSDSQRQATKDAGAIAGLNVMRIINEPTAAAIAFGLDRGQAAEQNVLVFDLGGGTLDVSLLNIEDGIFEVKAVNGDSHLGGADFDARMVRFCIDDILRRYGIDLSGDSKARNRLRAACERAKRQLSIEQSADVQMDIVKDGQDVSVKCRMSRARFEELNQDYFQRCLQAVESCLRDGGIDKEGVHEVLLVGGSSRIPRVRQMLQDFFGGKELRATINPEEAVAYGATVQSAMINGQGLSQVQDLLLLDVTPLSLGLAAFGTAFGTAALSDTAFPAIQQEDGATFNVLIPRNTTIPTQRKVKFTTRVDNQPAVAIPVYEGESAYLDRNWPVCTLRVDGLPPAPAGVPQIEVVFDLDANGILTVSAQELSTGRANQLTSTRERNRLTQADIDRIVAQAAEEQQERQAAPASPTASTAGPAPQAAAEGRATARIEQYRGGERDFLEPIMAAQDPYREFLKRSRTRHGQSPAFYLLAAQALHARGRPVDEVLRVATNALELGAEDAQLLRAVAYLALHLARYRFAVALFERVADLAPEEPQSFLDLALSLFFRLRQEEPPFEERKKDLARAMECAAQVVVGTWARRFEEVEWPALLALNWMAGYGEHVGCSREELWPAKMLPVEGFSLDVKSRLLVWLAWDTDRTDIDLHVREPSGEEVYYGNKCSRTGGILSKDFTQGYGPEVYLNRDAPSGTFHIRSKYYSSHQVSATTGATCAVIWRVSELGDFDREELSVSVVRLNRHKHMQDVLTVELRDDCKSLSSTATSIPGRFLPDEGASRAASLASVENVMAACSKPS